MPHLCYSSKFERIQTPYKSIYYSELYDIFTDQYVCTCERSYAIYNSFIGYLNDNNILMFLLNNL